MATGTLAPTVHSRRALVLWQGMWRPWWVRATIATLWFFLVLYPNPMMLVRSIQRVQSIPVDVEAVKALAATLPDDPRLIEQAVLDQYVPYALDWQVSGVPWYFPSTKEVLRDRAGDCESRATLLASLLSAKNIPYRMKISMDHLWVDYPGKEPNALENDDVAIGTGNGKGFKLTLPKPAEVWKTLKLSWDWYWTAMPWQRKVLLIGGLFVILLGARIASQVRRALLPARKRRVVA